MRGVRFAGYAAIFDRVDRGGDVVRRGAFARSLRRGASVPLLREHRGRAIGRVDYVREDGRGLRVIGRLREGTLAEGVGLSFGYRVRASRGPSTGSGQAGPRELIELELVEVSLVRFPMQPMARVHAVAE